VEFVTAIVSIFILRSACKSRIDIME
jgi:hypothetical protein